MRRIFLVILTLLIICSVNLFDAKNFFGGENFNLADAQEVEVTENFAEEVLYYVNVEREKVGLNPLKLSPNLMKAAEIRAEELPEKFSHTRPNGKPCFTAIKIPYKYVGENIAAGQRNPQAVVEAWMNSEGHRKNILSPKFGKLGVGYIYVPENEYRHFWVQLFKN